MIYRNKEKAKPNPAAENNRSPQPLPKRDVTQKRDYPAGKDRKMPIPSTRGYPGKEKIYR